MVAFTNTFFFFILTALLATYVEAAPWPIYTDAEAPSVAVNSFSKTSLVDSAKSFIASFGINADDMIYKSGFVDGTSRVAYVRQSINGIPVANAVANVAFNGDKVMSFATVAPAEPTVSWKSVLSEVEDALEGKYNGQNATLEYLAKSDGSVALTHVVQIQNEESSAWYEAYIDAHTGKLVSVTDFVAHASYTVLPTTKQVFTDGLETLVNPQDLLASPLGWHSIGPGNSTTTSSQLQLSVRRYPRSHKPYKLNAARTNAFFIANIVHDFSYRYGFTEDKFNFQLNNFGKGGNASDRVLISVQDASGVDNANFATPPDGQSGVCRMFIWDLTNPNRDGTMENDIVIHEMTHGITNRLTGGGTGRCLQTLEAGGMGRAGAMPWLRKWMNQNSSTTRDYIMGSYVINKATGIRTFPYSVDKAVNPLTYGSLRQVNEVHAIGEVWATILHQVYAALVDGRGFSADKLTNPDGTEGNIVYMHLFIDALSIQPCNPTFVEARDAWLAADRNRYNGANICTLEKAFASRGLALRLMIASLMTSLLTLVAK
ncbi:Fungalysin metallopeptidase-domain-containing protein [Flammula alnicola]|nr:Fungalysin metallopeptidase-domain-containing protein [Flammula alnicola]